MFTFLPAHPGMEWSFATEMEAEERSPENMQSRRRVEEYSWAHETAGRRRAKSAGNRKDLRMADTLEG